MKRKLKSLLIDILGGTNAFPTAQTDKSELTNFIRKLHPIFPGIESIRLGPSGDGGYLVPNDLTKIEACFSPGVSYISGFEKACADLGMKVFLADNSVDGPPVSDDLFSFTKKFIGASSSNDFITIDEWVDTSLPNSLSDLLLQIDIEGYEYETFLNISDRLMQRLRIIVVEFHNLEQFWSKPFFIIASRALERILQTHSCIHVHPNNCCGSLIKLGVELPCIMEFTFLRNDRVRCSSYANTFPHPLDRDNTNNPSLPLPTCWYHHRKQEISLSV